MAVERRVLFRKEGEDCGCHRTGSLRMKGVYMGMLLISCKRRTERKYSLD